MKLTPRLLLIVLGGIFVVLAIMLVIALVIGDRTPNDKQNNDLNTKSAAVLEPVLAR